MSQAWRRRLSQNFLWNRELVDRLVRASSISPRDLVLEIGPGRGILTQALLKSARRVIAVEIDARLCRSRRRLADPRLELIQADFIDIALPQESYKVFASLPYHLTGDILRKLLRADPAPSDCYLVVQQEAADKYVPGAAHHSLAAMLHYPWWHAQITHHFSRDDFVPEPRVDSALLQMHRRDSPLVPVEHKAAYMDFITYSFGNDRKAGQRSPHHWVSDFHVFLRTASRRQRAVVNGAFGQLQAQQAQLQEIHRTRTDPNWRRYKEKREGVFVSLGRPDRRLPIGYRTGG